MEQKPWYIELFENYSKSYDKEVFAQGTIQEVDFIENEIGFDKDKRILDIGCGTGRHSIELAKRGYQVTGFDISEDQLKSAKEKAEKDDLKVNFFQADARYFQLSTPFDLAIMLCEGGFPLMDTDEENFEILKNAVNSIKDGGLFILTTLSVLYPIFQNLKKFHDDNMVTGSMEEHSFDLMTFRDKNTMKIPDDDGNLRTLQCNERYYAPSEIEWLLKSLKFKQIDIYGCEVGNFKKRPLKIDDFEMLVVARK